MSATLPRSLLWMAVVWLLALPQWAYSEEIDLHLVLPWETETVEPSRSVEWSKRSDGEIFAVPAERRLSGQAIELSPEFLTWRPSRGVRPKELRWLAVSSALLLSDATTVKWFDADIREQPDGDEWGKHTSKLGTGLPLGIAILAPALLDGKHGRKTTRLTVMAVLNTTLLAEGIKFTTGRERPDQSGGALRFRGPGFGFTSFPSGHTAAASAVATVLGDRYPKYKLVFYCLAGAVALGRINAAAHFPSDVLVGASIGIYHGRLVLRHGGKLRLWK